MVVVGCAWWWMGVGWGGGVEGSLSALTKTWLEYLTKEQQMPGTPRKRWGNTPDTLCLAPWWWVAESESGTSRRRWEKMAAVEHPHFCKTSGIDVRQVIFKICDNARKTYFFLILAPITIESFFLTFLFKYMHTRTPMHPPPPPPHTEIHTVTHA